MKTLPLFALLLFSSPALAADSYDIDADHTRVQFQVNHLGVSDFLGMFVETTGSYEFNDVDPGKSSISVNIKTSSLNTFNVKRDDHLKSPDFFNAKQFPVVTFEGESFAKTGETWTVTGDLTLHGVTKTITVPFHKVGEADDPWGGHRSGYSGAFSVDRSDYGMDFMVGGVGDKIELTIAIEGIRK